MLILDVMLDYKKAQEIKKTKTEYEISERTVVTFYPSKVFRKELIQNQ